VDTLDPTRLTAYIASYVCHELVQPVTAMSYAADTINEPVDAELKTSAHAILIEGVAKLDARLQFLRYAFGSVGVGTGTADIHAARKISEAYVKTFRPSLEWDLDVANFTFGHARLLMNMIIMGKDSLPRGGVVNVRTRDDNGSMMIALTCKGDRAKLKDDLVSSANGVEPGSGWSADTVQPYFTRMLCEGLGGSFSVRLGESVVMIVASGVRLEA
jgi:histidine phosphotransferase ChpT